MYVCLCNAIRDSELEKLGGEGVVSAEEAYKRLGAEMVCMCCKDEAEEILAASRQHREPRLRLVAG